MIVIYIEHIHKLLSRFLYNNFNISKAPMDDEKLRNQIDEIFSAFDTDGSHTLNFGELYNFFTELFKRLGI